MAKYYNREFDILQDLQFKLTYDFYILFNFLFMRKSNFIRSGTYGYLYTTLLVQLEDEHIGKVWLSYKYTFIIQVSRTKVITNFYC